MSDYDVIVVGGGPAGSTAARQASQRGLEVLLLEKEKFPRVKPCAGGVINLVREILDFDVSEVVQREVYGQRFFSPSGLQIDCIRPTISGFMVMRSDFDNLLLQKAKDSGTEVREEVEVLDAEQDSKGVSVVTKDGENITAQYLVGADGINGVVAKRLGFYDGWKDASAALCIGVEAEVGKETVERVCGVEYDQEGISIDIYFGAVPNGYAWCFPKRTILSLGIGVSQDKALHLRERFNKWFSDFKNKYEVDPEIVSDVSYRVPYSGAVKNTVFGRTILLGDAAGFANPFSAEGISGAVRSGIIAAPVLERAVRETNPLILREYEKGWKAEFGEDLKVAKSLVKLMFKSEKNMETILGLAYKDPFISDNMYRLVAGQLTYAKFKSALVKRIMMKHPRAGLSLYI